MKRIFSIITAALLCLCLVLAAGCGKPKSDIEPAGGLAEAQAPDNPAATDIAEAPKVTDAKTMLVYNGRPISADEFRLFVLLANSEDTSAALDYILYALAVIDHAKADGITISDEQMATIDEDMSLLADYTTATEEHEAYFDPFDIPDDKLADWLATDYYAKQLYEKYTAGMSVTDEAAFNAELDKYYEEGQRYYTELLFKYVYVDDEGEAADAMAFIEGGGTFDDAIIQFSEDYYEEEGVTTMDMRELNLTDEWVERFLSMNEGEMAGPLDFGDGGFVIVEIEKNNRPPKAEVAETFRAEYLENIKYEYYNTLIEEWRAEAAYTLNDEAFAAFEMH